MEQVQILKLFSSAELLVPIFMHHFDLSLVELLINGRLMYNVKSDFASILFYLSMSMIFQAVRRKSNIDVIKMPLKIVGVVSDLFDS
jgi:hypothetical protein